jgi:hypothetical protein
MDSYMTEICRCADTGKPRPSHGRRAAGGYDEFERIKWSSDLDAQLVSMVTSGCSWCKIADALGAPKAAIINRLRRLRRKGIIT